MRAVLMQDGRHIAQESSKYIPAEANYSPTDQELLAVIPAAKRWQHLIEALSNEKVTLMMDHHL